MKIVRRCIVAVTLLLMSGVGFTQPDVAEPMNNARLDKLIRAVDENTEGRLGLWAFAVEGVSLQVITDEKADRIRILAPILKTENLDEAVLYRLLQANFDSTLDARYAIANGILWSTFIHPLASLDDESFLVSLGQTVNVAITYGASYSSGLLNFNGGDSRSILQHELIEKLKKKGKQI